MSSTPPGPKGIPLFGASRQYARDPFSFLTAVADAYGDVIHFDLGPLDTYMLTNPADIETVLVSEASKFRKPQFQDRAIGDLLGDGLLMSEGATWKKQRHLAQPAFDVRRISTMAEMMTDRTESMLSSWDDGDVVDVQLEMARLTVEIIVDAMFGTDLDDERIRRVQENLEPLGARFEPDPFRFLLPDWAPTRENREYKQALSVLEDLIWDIVDDRRGTEYASTPASSVAADDSVEGERMDLLSILLRAYDAGEQTEKNLRDELMTMLLAGHDTTALTLTYAWYLLSQHPEAEARLHRELDEVLGGRTPTFEDVQKLEYTERVLNEAMRLYPPVYVMFREPKVDVRLGGYRVPKGSAIMLPQWVVHRSERWWDDPLEFDPGQWTPERTQGRPRFAYFPFGGGPRHCIGKHLSMLEGRLILGTVAQAYELDYVRNELFSLRGSLTMHPQEPIGMRLRARE
ncbi:cytochrome P450 [Haloferax mediterranei ATCC 33500]|uniref:Cytochrome P450 n=1 Tax=Haloferax mediterranei (strain ATCC 33500 / DSM 1411 / JCM 8866 / NBRC 14739 / NCIMB 2177 / R-4) TaxID=523841 RepID=I3R0M1_HALMT|nr:cytochrome P450 [Haloferax mediterranei]AFK17781.1 unspecific monooxygenase (cytochrome P450) [Haloferax mediterranei ATCC 33500]EMA02948.1 unspecific monooxygenase (cytochrome P450) [Haloferax mediterranei ATCC 33500]MDX5987870.1 cytochrome P450 [Haloferax mediterranei ATCC 33500]QCQ74345.1 cytochrome P450 [Haloferax mediterranei ATCC 33500]